MTTLDTVVFLFGVLVTLMVCAGFVLMFYGHAALGQARREDPKLSAGMTRLAKLLGDEPAWLPARRKPTSGRLRRSLPGLAPEARSDRLLS